MKSRFNVRKLFLVGLLCVGYGTTVQGQVLDFADVDAAPLLRFGPTNPVNGYPMWLEATDTRPGALPGATILLELCEDTNDVTPAFSNDPVHGPAVPCPACVDAALDLPNPNLPQSFPDNYPDEHFFYLNESIMKEVATDNSLSILTVAIEGAFDGLGAVVDGEQVVFARYRVRVDNAMPGEMYQITYPNGRTYAEASNDQGGAAVSNINFTNDVFLWKGVDLRTPLDSIMGSFPVAVTPPPPAGAPAATDPATGIPIGPVNLFTYLQDFCGSVPIEGSPFGTNFFSVIGPNAGMILSSLNTGTPLISENQCDPLDPQMIAAFDAYDAYILANVDPLATPLPQIAANCTFSDAFTGIAKVATRLGVQVDRATYTRTTTAPASTQINVWANSFQGQDIQLSIPGIVGDIQMCGDGTGSYFAHVLMPSSFIPPTEVSVTNMTDNPPTSNTHALSANIVIQSAIADLGAGALTIAATVADPLQGASLSTGGFDFTAGTATIGLAGGTCGAVPPKSVSVASGQGGLISAPTQVVGVVPDLLAAAGGTAVVDMGASVTLDGSASLGAAGTTYSWLQTGGTDITLQAGWDATAISPTFTFPTASDLLTFELTLTDAFGATSTDTAIVTNTVVAVAGADQDLAVFPDAGAALDASATQGAGLTYTWTQIATDTIVSPQCVGQPLDGAISVVNDPAIAALATLTMPLEGGCVTLDLTVTGVGGTSSDTITIKAPVGAPVADAGTNLVVFAGELVQLNASASSGIISADGFTWTQLAGGLDTVALGEAAPGGTIDYISSATGATFNIDPLVGPIPAAADVTAPKISMPVFMFPLQFQTLNFQVDVVGPGGASSATVSVIVDNPAQADTLTPNRARYVENKERFVVSGNSSIDGPGHSVDCWLGSPSTGDYIGNGPVLQTGNGAWQIDVTLPVGVNPCLADPGIVDINDCTGTPIADHAFQVQCISTLGGTLLMDWEAK